MGDFFEGGPPQGRDLRKYRRDRKAWEKAYAAGRQAPDAYSQSYPGGRRRRRGGKLLLVVIVVLALAGVVFFLAT